MCYPKPGPRCSAHASAAFAKAHQKVLHAYMNSADSNTLNRLMKIRDKAKAEYRITLASIRELEASAEKEQTEWAWKDVEEAKKERQERLDLVKNQKSKSHKSSATLYEYINKDFSEEGEIVKEMSYDHPNLITSLKDSENWSHRLTDNELAAVAWYSQAGFSETNGRLCNPDGYHKNWYKNTPEEIDANIALLDSALAKHTPSNNGVKLYRRHLLYNNNGITKDHTEEEVAETFKPGSIYKPGFYLSTSLNQANLPSSGLGVISLEILSKTAVPITTVSSQGPREYEFLIPRDAEFKVISTIKMSNTKFRGKGLGEITVIQLQEL